MKEVFISGIRRERWDDTTRTYTAWNASGVQTSARPYTSAENAEADARIASAAIESNRASIEAALEAALADLQATIDATNSTINANPAAHIKTLARAQRRAIRLLIRRFDGTA